MTAANRSANAISTALSFLCLWLSCSFSHAQPDSAAVDRKKLHTFIIASGVGYTAGLVALNHIWYKNTERQSFRFFNDNAQWKQMDKGGHFFSSFYLSDIPARFLKRYNVAEKKAHLIGALSGFLVMLPIEVFDGHSDGYGASLGDLVANAAGPAFFLGQQLAWKEIRIHPKFSFQRSGYAALRPDLLGENLLGEIVKDYNGQTYWLSFDVDKFMVFPRWLNIAAGYGAEEMVHGRDRENRDLGFRPYRQFYLAIDFDLSAIRTRSKLIKTMLYVVNMVRLPAPAFEISRRGSKFHPFFF